MTKSALCSFQPISGICERQHMARWKIPSHGAVSHTSSKFKFDQARRVLVRINRRLLPSPFVIKLPLTLPPNSPFIPSPITTTFLTRLGPALVHKVFLFLRYFFFLPSFYTTQHIPTEPEQQHPKKKNPPHKWQFRSKSTTASPEASTR